jgi:rod shape-determining protein MreC
VLGVLVLLSLVLITVSFRDPGSGALHGIESAGATILRPFEVAAERVARPFRDAYAYFADLVNVKEENEKLKEQISQLRQQAVQGATAQEQLDHLRDLLQFIDSPLFPSEYEPVNTRVISWASEFDRRVVIAAGTDHGIREETPVVTREGLVGSVTEVSGSAALVTLLTDESSAVQARDQKTNATGLVRHGQGEGSLILDFVPKDQRINRGDVIVTAGTLNSRYPSLFPRGIPIGVVTSVGQSDTALFWQVQIDPFVDFSSLDAVTALKTRKRIPKGP